MVLFHIQYHIKNNLMYFRILYKLSFHNRFIQRLQECDLKIKRAFDKFMKMTRSVRLAVSVYDN